MSKKDSLLSAAAGLGVAVFLVPTLLNTNIGSKIPLFPLSLLALPVFTYGGMFVASIIGRSFPILWQLAKFALVGVLNTAIDFGALNFLIARTGVVSGPLIIALNATSFSLAVINSYFWNKGWVFPEGKKSNFLTFFAVTLVGLAINSGVVFILTTFVSPVFVTSSKLWANLAKVLATGLSLVWNFLGYRLIVFKR
ncbi:hypothetical protein A2870_00630 [Candidatus Curtissbacteria bacterium RIFCSPHIGHO2_01_FULL_41_11]|uniref:GtrA/DPMS transmembrane domain-containing protein n=1 Tax=Candidatus Curtissbacteria bacterium RIFCSPHIGHO2_01_FULL_41_11 TaxID=1797711 RepID=A0A1F5G3D4_9BACT|nr:MAG: hypothetical protein A2870_00630 [Candidatus Curtissbacteria bacterium RIFCSPHIGHO2_01_FULL_41_11]